MKHPLPTTLILILLFLTAQLAGLFVVYKYISGVNSDGELEYTELPFGQQRPEVENKSMSFIWIAIAVFLGTLILLGLIKFKFYKVWKIWFFLAIFFALIIAFSTFMNQWLALIIALILASWKIWKPNVWIHNLSEIFIYAGIAAIIVPMLNMVAVFTLLVLISVYDYWAVFKSKHMVDLAKASTEAKIFPGLYIDYSSSREYSNSTKEKVRLKNSSSNAHKVSASLSSSSAVLGGGDIAFALLFAGTSLASFYTQPFAILKALVIVLFATLGVSIILFLGKKGRFYPAMPFVSLGCFIGYGISLLI